MDRDELYRAAEARVESEPSLQPYRDILLDYDWAWRDDHLQWVATDPLEKLLIWAQLVRKDEEQAAELAQEN